MSAVIPIWSVYDYIFSSIFWCTGIVGFFANTYLIYLIITKSPPSLEVYRVFLLNVAIADLLFTTSTTFGQIRIIPNKWAFAYVPLGPARYFGPEIGYLSYCVQLHAIFYTFLSFPLSFGFRYWVLVRPVPTVTQCVALCMGLWSIAVAQHVMFICSETPHEEIRAYLEINKPSYNMTGWQLSGNNMTTQVLTVVTLATIVLPMFPIYCVVMYFYRKVQRYLNENNSNMREGTIKGHRRLIMALTIQASLPVLFVFPAIGIYGLYHLEFINFTIIEYLVYVIFSFFPACSPFVTMYFVKPYNMSVRALFCMPTRVVDLSTATQMDRVTRYDSSHLK